MVKPQMFSENTTPVNADVGLPAIRQQLQMVWPLDRLGSPPVWTLPHGYSLRTWQDGDAKAYIRLMNLASFQTWDHERLAAVLSICLPGGLFFAVHDKTKEIVGTAVALHNPIAFHPHGGELGWVAVAPDHRGHNLGYVVCAAATKRLLDAGYSDIFLRTDDFRLAAIKVYLKLGYIPFLHGPDMAERWQVVCQKLGLAWAHMRKAGPLAL